MKTPILRPAAEAVLFGFERIGMVIRIAWLPIVLVLALYAATFFFLVGEAGLSSMPPIDGDDPEEAMRALLEMEGVATFYALQMTILPLLATLLLSCVFVAVTRASTLADYEPPRTPFYFALGAREIRYFLAVLFYVILLFLAAAALAGVGAAVCFAAVSAAGGLADQAKAIVFAPMAAIILWLALVWMWLAVRFLPALPIAAVENRISFGDAWKMTKGNFWRLVLSTVMFFAMLQTLLFVLLLAIFLPAAVILGLVAGFGYGFMGEAALAVFALLVILAIPAVIALIAFAVAARAAFPGRIYAYLSGCGDACRI